MRWNNAFIPTLRDDPADAEAASHRLLVRAGFVRQLMSGVYSLLPLGFRVARKIERIIREEIVNIGGQEFFLPCLQPFELWERTGRGAIPEAFRVKDRHGADLVLGLTHEEVCTSLARELRSYKELPQLWFHFQTKFRDEERPKSGLLRVREFVMKDSYSLDIDQAGLDLQFQRHFEAYRRIFERCGLDTVVAVEASSGAMGGSESVEFMLATEAGEDWTVSCAACGYAANLEKAVSALPDMQDEAGLPAPEKWATPGVRTIEALANFPGGAPAERQIKSLVYQVDGAPVLALLRGDHPLLLQKLLDGLGASDAAPAGVEEIVALLGAKPGSLGACGVKNVKIVADHALRGRRDMQTGANQDDFHLRGVEVERDIDVAQWLDLRAVQDGEACPLCGERLAMRRSVEVGHIFKLGVRYSEALGAAVQGEDGKPTPLVMGSYGIGVGRLLAAVAERRHDEAGIVWPVNTAPFEVVISVLNPKEVAVLERGEQLYEALLAAGIDALLDDRDERPGVKFKDAELLGVPYRLTVGPKGLAAGQVEIFKRSSGRTQEVKVERAAETVAEYVLEDRC